MGDLSLRAAGRIAKRVTGARIANPAKEALRDAAEAQAEELARAAWEIAKNAGRTTVLKEDVLLAQRLRR